jgi:hypothetical protein
VTHGFKLNTKEREMFMSEIDLTQARVGDLNFFPLELLTTQAKNKNINTEEWGICQYGNTIWLGSVEAPEHKSALKLPLLEVIEKREEVFADWGDEELFVFFMIDSNSGQFQWFLLTKPQTEEVFKQYNERNSKIN